MSAFLQSGRRAIAGRGWIGSAPCSRVAAGGVVLCVLIGPGCAATTLSPLHYSVRHLREVDPFEVFQIAEGVLEVMNYQIEQADPFENVIVTRPRSVFPPGARQPGTVGVGQPAMRQVAEVRLAEQQDVLGVFCRVRIEQQTTESHRLIRDSRTSSDLPGETPLERGEAATLEQRTVWQMVSRDKVVERRILERIIERIGGARDEPD